MKILAFETSCDETSAAVLEDEKVISNVVLSQISHNQWGGVVPELASREHLKNIVYITEKALKSANTDIQKIELIAATNQPGLVGALLIGFSFAKSLAIALDVPFIPVNHIQAHLYSSFLQEEKPNFPFISLIVSGGHTLLVLVEDYFKHRILGTTVDDAAGEAFDKVAKLLGLGYPGGPIIDKLAKEGDKKFHKFPLATVKNSPYNFSFSGIKTSVLYFLKEIDFERNKSEKLISDICASFQEAVTESLFRKTVKVAKEYNIKTIAISGGVAANSELKNKFESLKSKGFKIFIPPLGYITDNGAMIGYTALLKYKYIYNKECFLVESLKETVTPRLNEI
ncbi:MAG: tRNA (adenosine(37)-N6)-threonylcarbamoyltransferase complex transferase subunit TsaD [Ignavibacteria bacterium]|nr:tRNA (adenosine(37)-N6)-threonylcarbamoyltransferase complex transferase subunit TsaD [Ignavibacteria bacterium]